MNGRGVGDFRVQVDPDAVHQGRLVALWRRRRGGRRSMENCGDKGVGTEISGRGEIVNPKPKSSRLT